MPDSLVISGGSEALFRVLDVANRLGASLDRETLMDEFGAAVGALLDAEIGRASCRERVSYHV